MRKILIVPTGEVDNFTKMATDNEIGEIIEGIPKGLSNLYNVNDLPIIHTEEVVVSELTETELLNQKIITLQEQLDSATEAIDFLIMGGM